jgi:hypothetical protein
MAVSDACEGDRRADGGGGVRIMGPRMVATSSCYPVVPAKGRCVPCGKPIRPGQLYVPGPPVRHLGCSGECARCGGSGVEPGTVVIPAGQGSGFNSLDPDPLDRGSYVPCSLCHGPYRGMRCP